VLLRRRAGSEEVLVSALLAPLQFVDQDPLPRAALIKVFVSKPGATPVLHFDCRASWVGEEERGAADYAINAVRYHSSPGTAGEDEYEGPEFRWCSYALLVLIFIFVFKNSSLDVCCCLHNAFTANKAGFTAHVKHMNWTNKAGFASRKNCKTSISFPHMCCVVLILIVYLFCKDYNRSQHI
jgi:hypothetical protein